MAGYQNANKLLVQMQGDDENGIFSIKKNTEKDRTDIVLCFEKCLELKFTKTCHMYRDINHILGTGPNRFSKRIRSDSMKSSLTPLISV